jgi:hypothetical protein
LNEIRVTFAGFVREWDFVLGETLLEKAWKAEIRDHHMVKVGDL